MANKTQSLINLAEKQLGQHNPQLALQTLAEAIKLAPDDAWAHQMQAHAYYEYYRQNFKRKNLKLALSAIEHSISLYPESAQAFYLKGMILKITSARKANKAFQKAIELAPYNAEYHVALGALEVDMDVTMTRPIKRFEKALELDPENVSALVFLAKTEISKRGNVTKAEQYAKSAYDIASHDIEVLTLMGNILYHKGQYEDAKNFARQAVAINPKDYGALELIFFLELGKNRIVRVLNKANIYCKNPKVLALLILTPLVALILFGANWLNANFDERTTSYVFKAGLFCFFITVAFIRWRVHKKIMKDYINDTNLDEKF